ncbi:hypothetical protein ACWCRF_14540 [Streptomyces sp. NPDC002405]
MPSLPAGVVDAVGGRAAGTARAGSSPSVDELREEPDRIQAEPAVAEREGQERAIARSRAGEVPAPADGTGQDRARADESVPAAEGRGATAPRPAEAAKPKSQAPVWREGLDRPALSVDCQRILKAAADRPWLGQGPVICQGPAAAFGMDVVPARVEAPRSKAKHLLARGRPAEPAAGRFTPLPSGGQRHHRGKGWEPPPTPRIPSGRRRARAPASQARPRTCLPAVGDCLDAVLEDIRTRTDVAHTVGRAAF